MEKIKGVNLGNWLVLEKWMSPVVFEGIEAEDETWLARKTPQEELKIRMKAHRETYITERDFSFIVSKGLNMVRIPVPYFIFGDRPPFIGCIEYLDKAFNWAEKYGLKILIDLHTAPGSQNGFDNGGLSGVCKWAQMPKEVEFELTVLVRLAERYGERDGLWGIEVINEPVSEEFWTMLCETKRYLPVDEKEAKGSKAVSSEFLRKFYVDAYHRMRKYLPEEKAVVIHDGFRTKEWKDFMQEPEFNNVVLDMHCYVMGAEMVGCPPEVNAYVSYIKDVFAKDIAEMQQYFPVIVG